MVLSVLTTASAFLKPMEQHTVRQYCGHFHNNNAYMCKFYSVWLKSIYLDIQTLLFGPVLSDPIMMCGHELKLLKICAPLLAVH